MRIEPVAWTKKMQTLTQNEDVVAVADAAEISGAFPTIASLIRDHPASNIDKLNRALGGAYSLLLAVLEPEDGDIEQAAKQVIEAIRALYQNAHDEKELTFRRAKVIELILYRRVAPLYATDECLMNCVVVPDVPNEHFKNIAGREFDLCAWNEDDLSGEAYECGILPHMLGHRDCQALVQLFNAVDVEFEDEEFWFRVGLVSFQHSKHMYQRVKYLGGGREQDKAEFGRLKLYGYDNLDNIME